MINNLNIDEKQCFKLCLVRCLHSADHRPARIRKADKIFEKELDFPSKLEIFGKLKKNNFIGISVFGYKNKKKYPIYVVSKNTFKRHFDLLL